MAVVPSYQEKRHFLTKHDNRRAELRKVVDDGADQLHEKRALADALQTDDRQLVDRIHALGFDEDTVRVFDLLPLIHVCWADGRVQAAERKTVFAILEQRGIDPDSDASLLVESLLQHRPSDHFLEESLALLRELTARSKDEAETVVDLCTLVADASAGLLGLGARISKEERELIAQVADVLGETAQKRFREVLGG